MIDRQDLRDAWQYVLLIAPAPLGALIGLRYATEQAPRARAFTWLCSCALGAIVGPWLGELLALSPAGVAVATLVTAAVGMEVMAGVAAAARAFAADPLGFLGKAFTLFRKGDS
jgi:FtsH-binding integral membrane protein